MAYLYHQLTAYKDVGLKTINQRVYTINSWVKALKPDAMGFLC
ncbi:hypothetical protein clem_07440 [Legionella clemsonensis]|uniref:Uncharacterized protein n=1 Tax=Legionella clemsonensis TaxID=1867846 RepID=A0A222P2J0_9GAMM|nr:hypothetical protein clem_07440 [Legionella clemsonensis]